MTKHRYFNASADLSAAIHTFPNRVLLCDENSRKFCLSKLELPAETPLIEIAAGEIHKSVETLLGILGRLTELNTGRDTVILNIGGGVLTDAGGFAASVYKRGISFVNVPTTLMAMVDAGFGGKTGVNFRGYKNYLGTFAEPQEVWVWPGFLETLPERQLRSGFAEMIKHGLIADRTYFELLSQGLEDWTPTNHNWLTMIRRSVEIKTRIVSSDFKEAGLRKILNFGHTLGHAIESYFMDEQLPHGFCVAAGMIAESKLSNERGLLAEDDLNAIIQVIDRVFRRIPLTRGQIEEIARFTQMDKKNTAQKIHCVFLHGIGKAEYDQPISLEEVEAGLNFYAGS